MTTLTKNLDFNLRMYHQKISYERRGYESVEKNSGSKGLMCVCAFVCVKEYPHA